MAADSANIPSDTEMAECDGDKVVTMMDVLQEQQEFEEDANAVLGASDDNNCTYSQGYIKRQAIYACLTCCAEVKTDPSKRAGVCLACSLNCHENHELVELYTKRNFRCDCGNPKFNSNPCQFTPNKTELNSNNVYNQNFSGLYCTCHRPYPDPENTVEDDMIQCIICEDWHHASHLNTVVPPNDQYSEMICKDCMDRNEFLQDYGNFAINSESIDVDVITTNGENPFIHNEEIKNNEINSDTELKTGISNGIDVDLSDDKANATDKNEETSNEQNIVQNEVESEKNTESNVDNQMDTEYINDGPLSDNKSAEYENTDFSKDEVPHTEDKNTSNIENEIKTNITDNEIVKTCESSEELAIESQEQKEILTSDETAKLSDSSDQQTEESSEWPAFKEPPLVSEEQAETNKDEKSVSEATLDSTQQKHIEKDNSDAVMDAIDELLESHEELNIKTNNLEQHCEELSKNKDENQTETHNTSEEIQRISVDRECPNTNVVSETELNNTKDINGSSETSTELEKIEDVANESHSIIDENSETTEKNDLTNSDSSHNNITLSATDSTSKQDNNSPITIEPSLVSDDTPNLSTITNENKRKMSSELTDETIKKAKLDINKCVRPKGVKKIFKGATFWPSNFRQILCKCGECITMYKDLNVLFLTDLEDTVSFYESLGKENVDARASQYERGLQALSSLDRIQQINALTEYNNMRDRLLDFLKSFKDRQEIVKEEDIRAFFAGMKPRREPDGVYFCR